MKGIISLFTGTLLTAVLSLPLNLMADGVDAIFAATETYSGEKLIRVYNPDGTPVDNITIGEDFVENTHFLAGNWIAGQPVSVVALKDNGEEDQQKKKIEVSFLGKDGIPVSQINLGKNVLRVLAVDFDGSGLSDLVVQRKDQPVAVYLDPGVSPENMINIETPKNSDVIVVLKNGSQDLGFMRLSSDTKNLAAKSSSTLLAAKKKKKKAKKKKKTKKKVKKKKKSKKKKNSKKKKKKKKGKKDKKDKMKSFIQYTNDAGALVQLKVDQDIQAIYPLRLTGTVAGDVSAFLLVSGRKLTMIGEAIETKKMRKSKEATVFTGFFNSPAATEIAIGRKDSESVDANISKLSLLNPVTDEKTVVEFDMNAQLEETPTPTPEPEATPTPTPEVDPDKEYCERFNELMEKFYQAVDSGDWDKALRLAEILDAMDSDRCRADYDGDGDGDYDDDDDDVFRNNGVTYIESTVVYGSNTGMARGPCDEFLDAPDGFGGFLAKNSDHGGIVYLTPGSSYSNGRILHPRTFEVMEHTEYSGIANGGRGHHRTGGSLPRGEHIFAADHYYGDTHCWRIPDGYSRVD